MSAGASFQRRRWCGCFAASVRAIEWPCPNRKLSITPSARPYLLHLPGAMFVRVCCQHVRVPRPHFTIIELWVFECKPDSPRARWSGSAKRSLHTLLICREYETWPAGGNGVPVRSKNIQLSVCAACVVVGGRADDVHTIRYQYDGDEVLVQQFMWLPIRVKARAACAACGRSSQRWRRSGVLWNKHKHARTPRALDARIRVVVVVVNRQI